MNLIVLLLVILLGAAAGWAARDRVRWIELSRVLTRYALGALLCIMGSKLALNRGLFAQDLSVFFAAIGSSLLLGLLYFGAFLLFRALVPSRGSRAEATLEGPATVGGGHEVMAVALNAGWIAAGFLVFLLLPDRLGKALPIDALADWLLRALLLFIGFDLGAELHRLDLRKLAPHLILVPFVNILFTLACGALFGLLTRHGVRHGLLLYAGLGWYSLSSVLLAERGLVLLSILAFIHNVFRELLAILCAPLAAKVSPYLPVYLGGATAMDVMLPFVQRYSGREYTLVSFYSGVVCSLAVIPLVRLIVGN